MTFFKRLSNVQAIVFYDLDQNDSTIRSIENLLEPYTCREFVCPPNRNDHIFKIVGANDLKTPFKPLIYKNRNAKGKSKAKFIANKCPVARLFGHKNDSSQAPKTSCIFGEEETHGTEKTKKTFGKTIKIEVCLRNVPGALKELADVIAIQR